jgi:hypothetical protein
MVVLQLNSGPSTVDQGKGTLIDIESLLVEG